MDTTANPFQVLGATPLDRKPRLMELAEDAALHGDGTAADHARATLINPRNRLAAEIGWYPGVPPERVAAMLAAATSGGPPELPGSLPPLAEANLELARLEAATSLDAARLQKAILRIAACVDRLDPAALMQAIDTDRTVAGFPPVGDVAPVEHETAERVRAIQRALTARLDALPTALMVATYGHLMTHCAEPGAPAPRLLVELLAAYELHAGGFLSGEAERILGLLEATRAAADAHAPPAQVHGGVQQIAAAIVDWDRVAQPIQLARQRAGLDHDDSNRLAYRARALAVHLFNAHDYLDDAKLLSATLKDTFAEVAAVHELVQGDAVALDGIEAQRRAAADEAAQAKAKFVEETTWEGTLGLVFKDRLRISPDGIDYKNRMTPAAQITGVTWGAIRRVQNGRDAGTSYYFKYGTPTGSTDIVLGGEAQYAELVPRVWRALCVPMMLAMVERWKAGEALRIGGHEVRDDGIVLKHSRTFRADEWRFFPWTAMGKRTHGGALIFTGKPEADFTASFAFLEVLNAHILDFVVDRIWQGKAGRLGAVFDQG